MTNNALSLCHAYNLRWMVIILSQKKKNHKIFYLVTMKMHNPLTIQIESVESSTENISTHENCSYWFVIWFSVCGWSFPRKGKKINYFRFMGTKFIKFWTWQRVTVTWHRNEAAYSVLLRKRNDNSKNCPVLRLCQSHCQRKTVQRRIRKTEK